jgi:dTDP-4-dehydrorhamnose reductase
MARSHPPLLITGLNGSLAPILARAATAEGYAVVGWDRAQVPPGDAAACEAHLAALQPHAIFHLAMGSEAWGAQLARFAQVRQIPMIFTSTAMVFDHEPDGPHAVGDLRTAKDDYGRYKIRCEDAILAANPNSHVMRIGWQIDPTVRGNNMLHALDDWQRREGQVAVSRQWRPACSFMSDTASALLLKLTQPAPGIHHFDSNACEGHSFEAIARALQFQFTRPSWRIVPNDDYLHDQRLHSEVPLAPKLSSRLTTLIAEA